MYANLSKNNFGLRTSIHCQFNTIAHLFKTWCYRHINLYLAVITICLFTCPYDNHIFVLPLTSTSLTIVSLSTRLGAKPTPIRYYAVPLSNQVHEMQLLQSLSCSVLGDQSLHCCRLVCSRTCKAVFTIDWLVDNSKWTKENIFCVWELSRNIVALVTTHSHNDMVWINDTFFG